MSNSSSCFNIKSQMGQKIIDDEHTDCILIVKDDVRMTTCMKQTLIEAGAGHFHVLFPLLLANSLQGNKNSMY